VTFRSLSQSLFDSLPGDFVKIAGLFRRSRREDRAVPQEPGISRVCPHAGPDVLLDGLVGEVLPDAGQASQHDAVYDVIGGGNISSAVPAIPKVAPVRESSVDADQLLDMLYAQYRLALVLPDSVHQEGRWVAGNLRNTQRDARSAVQDDSAVMKGTVSEFLHGNPSIDQAFGLLPGELPESLQPVEPPEVLALFAPPELQANIARHERMPTLARREHHLVSIDSAIAPTISATRTQTDAPQLSES
jgi:hypothetical protein